MAKWEKSRRVRGKEVHEVALDALGWIAAEEVAWTYELFGRRLKRFGKLVAESVASLRDAVLYSMAYETAREDMRAEARRAELHIARHPDDNACVLKMREGGMKE